MRHAGSWTLALVLTLFVAVPAAAQDVDGFSGKRVVDASFMDATVAGHESAAERDRVTLAELLENDQVQELAQDRGIAMERVQSAASTLSDQELQEISPLLAEAIEAIQSGGYITISVYTVIIILLLLILLT